MSGNDKNKTLVFGASLKPERISNLVIHRLLKHKQKVLAIGGRQGTVEGIEILKGHPVLDGVHTITMYMGEARQKYHEDYLLSLEPKRIIFNPGAENPEFAFRARKKGIITENACTLVMLTTGQYGEEI